MMDTENPAESPSLCESQEVAEEVEPFNFLELPRDIQILICRQMDLKTYVNLLKTSKLVRNLELGSRNLLFEKEAAYIMFLKLRLQVVFYHPPKWHRKIFIWEQLESSPVAIFTKDFKLCAPFTDEKLLKLTKLFGENRLRTNCLEFHCDDVENMENVLNLIDIVKPTTLITHTPWPGDFYLDPRMKSITKLDMNDYGCEESTFLSLKIPQEIHMSGERLTHHSLRMFFMQLYRGERTVELVKISYDHNILNNFDDLELTTSDILLPIWTQAAHHLTLLKDYPLSQVLIWDNY